MDARRDVVALACFADENGVSAISFHKMEAGCSGQLLHNSECLPLASGEVVDTNDSVPSG